MGLRIHPQGSTIQAEVCVNKGMVGALANAIFDACGARVYQMPLTTERILEAIKGQP